MSDIEMKAKFRDWFTTKAPKQFKEMFAKITEDEGIMLEICFHQFAEMVANGVNTSDSGLHLQRVNNLAKLAEFIRQQKDLPPEINDIVNDNFWDLI